MGQVVNRYKMAKHFELMIADRAFSYTRKEEKIAAEAALDASTCFAPPARKKSSAPRQ